MPELELIQVYKRLRKYLMALLLLFLIGMAFQAYRPFFVGLFLGTAVSLFNLRILARKTISIADAAGTGKKPRALGTGLRMAMAVIAVMFAYRYPESINVFCVIIGIMTSYMVIMIDLFVGLLRQSK